MRMRRPISVTPSSWAAYVGTHVAGRHQKHRFVTVSLRPQLATRCARSEGTTPGPLDEPSRVPACGADHVESPPTGLLRQVGERSKSCPGGLRSKSTRTPTIIGSAEAPTPQPGASSGSLTTALRTALALDPVSAGRYPYGPDHLRAGAEVHHAVTPERGYIGGSRVEPIASAKKIVSLSSSKEAL
jgi:hypothetical protein